MFFPESLYELSQRDQQVTWLDPLFFTRARSDPAASIDFDYTVPIDRALILQHALLSSAPGAAQNVVIQHINFLRGDTMGTLALTDNPLAVGVRGLLSWQGSLVIPGGWVIVALATFNAAVAANFARLSLAGILIPIGNIQRI